MSEAMFETVTSETVNTRPKPTAAPRGAADGHVLAEVEKWMAMIREISGETAKD
jgi:hypothetical protein